MDKQNREQAIQGDQQTLWKDTCHQYVYKMYVDNENTSKNSIHLQYSLKIATLLNNISQ